MEGSLAANSLQFTQLTDRRQQNLPVDSERRLASQINKYDSMANKENNLFFEGLVSTMPAARRVLNVEDNVKNQDTFKAVGIGAFALITLKEDLRDLLSIVGLSKANTPEGCYSRYKFFAGTFLEKHLEKSKWGTKILEKYDKTIAETKIGTQIKAFLNVDEDVKRCIKKTKFPFCEPERLFRDYVKHEGTFVKKLTSLSLNRITIPGLLFMSLLEIPSIYKAVKNEEDYSQIAKSGTNVILGNVCGALFSAFGSLTTKSSAGSVIGFGLGTFVGNKLAKNLFKQESD